jgi:uncharacterized protein
MTYNRERFRSYSEWIYTRRWRVILGALILLVAMALGSNPKFAGNDASLWVSGSKEQLRNEASDINAFHQLKLVYRLDGSRSFADHLERVRELHQDIRTVKGVVDIRSILTLSRPYENRGDAGSALLELEKLCDSDTGRVRDVVTRHYDLYRPYADTELKHFYVYVFTDSKESLETVRTFVDETYTPNRDATRSYLITIGIVIGIGALIFLLIFGHVLPALLSIIVTVSSLIATLFLAQRVFGIDRIYLSVTLLILAISQMDFIYFYYRWHVDQFKYSARESLHKALNRNLEPAFLTSVVTSLGLGSLVLIDIPVLHQIGVIALLSAFLGFFFSATLLPALLSLFEVRNAYVPFSGFSRFFASREIHYNRRLLNLFLMVVLVAGVFAAYTFIMTPPKIFDRQAHNDALILAVPFEEIDAPTVARVAVLEQEVASRFQEVVATESLHSIMAKMAGLEGQTLNAEQVGRYLFFVELYGESERLIRGDTLLVHIWLKKGTEAKNDIVAWTRRWSETRFPVHLADQESLAYAAKSDDAIIMGTSIFSALLLIGVIMFLVTRKYQLLLISWLINSIPIVAFAGMVIVLQIPLSVEILIAVTIMLGLASDATIHFSYKYMQSRHYYHDRVIALEKVFFYAGLPVIIGNLLLASIFFVLAATTVTLQTIGYYAAALIIVSLLVDLFVMPVLLLFVDKKNALEE